MPQGSRRYRFNFLKGLTSKVMFAFAVLTPINAKTDVQDSSAAYGALAFPLPDQKNRNSSFRTSRAHGRVVKGALNDDTTRIVNGRPVPRGKYPWVVAIASVGQDNLLYQYCGGALVDRRWVITAAHCGVEVGDLVIADRVNLTSNDGRLLHVSAVQLGPYDQFSLDGDIALLKLSESVSLPNISLHRIRDSVLRDGTNLIITGWGRTSIDEPDSNILLEANVSTVAIVDCRDAYQVAGLSLTDTMFCGSSDRADACTGDSGGPAFSQTSLNRYELLGIVSWGKDCGQRAFPGVYTVIADFADAIDSCIDSDKPNCVLMPRSAIAPIKRKGSAL